MSSSRTARTAARTAAALFAGVVAFQVAVAGGAPWGEYTQGGSTSGALPASGRAVAGGSAGLLAVMALALLGRAGDGPLATAPRRPVTVAAWCTTGYLAVGLLLNLITPSRKERALWAPVTAALLGCAVTTMRATSQRRATAGEASPGPA